MNDGGWLKLYWKLKDNPVYDNSSTLAFWVHILLSTARKRHLLRNGQTLEVGQCLISTRSVAEWLQVSDRTVRRYVDFLSAETMVEVLKRDRNGTLVSVCNWGTYQNIDCGDVREMQRNDVASATQRRSNSAQTEIPKKGKKGKKGFQKPTTEDIQEFASSKNLPDKSDDFWHYYESNGWRAGKNPMKSWQSAYHRWCKRDFGDSQKQTPETPEPCLAFGNDQPETSEQRRAREAQNGRA